MWKLNFQKFLFHFVCLVSLKVIFTINNAENSDRKVQVWKDTYKFFKLHHYNSKTVPKV